MNVCTTPCSKWRDILVYKLNSDLKPEGQQWYFSLDQSIGPTDGGILASGSNKLHSWCPWDYIVQTSIVIPNFPLNVSSGRSYFNGTNGQHGSVCWALPYLKDCRAVPMQGSGWTWIPGEREVIVMICHSALQGREESPARSGWPRGGCDWAKLDLSVISAFC